MSPGHDKLITKMLPAHLVIHGAVQNDPNSNYELYLTEFLNASAYFMGKTRGNPFVFQEEQSKGQCDCYAKIGTEEYGLDFKLFGSEKALQGKSLFSLQAIKYGDCFWAITEPKMKSGSITGTWILSILKDRTLAELERIDTSYFLASPETLMEREIQAALKVMKVKKNLFLLLTYRFFFPTDFQYDYEEEMTDLILSISEKLESVIAFRQAYTDELETFFSFLFEDELIITEFQNGHLELIDHIPITASKVFCELNLLIEPFGEVKPRRG